MASRADETPQVYRGKVAHWNEDKGFGFIESDALEVDVFFHFSQAAGMARAGRHR